MAHELSFNKATGTLSMVYAGTTPWHGGGVKIVEPVTRLDSEFRALAGFNYNVDRVQLQYKYCDEWLDVKDRFVLVRSDTGRAIGEVSDHYPILQPRDACEIWQPLVDSKEITIETAGSLKHGSRMWLLARINRDPIDVLPGDTFKKYLLLSNAWTGKHSIFYGETDVRVVCNNTHVQALSAKDSKLLRISHKGDLATKIAKAKEAIDLVNSQFEKTIGLYRELARKEVGEKELTAFFNAVTKLTKDEQEAALKSSSKPEAATPTYSVDEYLTDVANDTREKGAALLEACLEDTAKQKEKQSRTVNELLELADHGLGTEIPGVKGTLYGAYNAVTEYCNHKGQDRGTEARLDSLGFGHANRMINRALDIATKML